MRMLKYFLPLMAVAALSSGIAAVVYAPDDYDVHALKQVEKNKSVVNVLNKGNNLFLSGDVRAKWQVQQRENNGSDQLGSGTGLPTNFFISEVNMLIDYDASCAWAQVKLNFRNCMGTQSGTDDSLRVERAFVGYDFIHCGDWDLYLELGRQKMDYLFESEVMFNSTYDGALMGVDYSWEEAGDFFIHGGPFIISNSNNQYGWVGEIGAMEIAETGIYAKYAFISWRKKGVDTFGVHDSPNFRYQISHLVLGYVFSPDTFRFPARIYAAGLYNHAAKSMTVSNNEKLPWGWYAGVELGKLEIAGDWALNVNYQWVQFDAMPSYDVAGVGRGYSSECPTGDSAALVEPLQEYVVAQQNVSAAGKSPSGIQGNTNYKGVIATGFYNVTANLALRACYQHSNQITKAIGGTHQYNDFELGVVYSY